MPLGSLLYRLYSPNLIASLAQQAAIDPNLHTTHPTPFATDIVTGSHKQAE